MMRVLLFSLLISLLVLSALPIPARAQTIQIGGSHLWSKRFGSTGEDSGHGVAVDSSGNVVVTGFFQGTVDFGGGGLTSAGELDIFVAKFSGADGSHLWSKRFGSTAFEEGREVAVDGSGNVVVTGLFEGTVDFGGGGLTSVGRYDRHDIFVAKFSGANGSHLWSKRFGSADFFDAGVGTAVDSSGNVVVTGWFTGTVDFGGENLTSAGIDDVFVAQFSGADGSHLWSKRFGSTGNDEGLGVAVDGSGNVLVTGYFTGTVDFAGGGLTSAGNSDIFVAKLAPTSGASTPPAVALLNQINVRIPSSTRSAWDIPALLSIGGKQSNPATIAVAP